MGGYTIRHCLEAEEALASSGNQRRPGLTVEGGEEGFLKEVSSELGLGDDDGEVPGGEAGGPPFSCISPRPGGAGWWGWFQVVLRSLSHQILAKITHRCWVWREVLLAPFSVTYTGSCSK